MFLLYRSTYYPAAYNPQQNKLVLSCPPRNCFVTPYTIVMVPGTLTHCYISYRFWGSPSSITPHPLPISNYASASLFWKSNGSSHLPNIELAQPHEYSWPAAPYHANIWKSIQHKKMGHKLPDIRPVSINIFRSYFFCPTSHVASMFSSEIFLSEKNTSYYFFSVS